MQLMVLNIMSFKTIFGRISPRAAVKVASLAYSILFSGFAMAQTLNSADFGRGAYLARVADCVACHTAGTQSPRFAGGLAINSPFGIIYSTNITPDEINGIGRYTLNDFSRAVRNGIAKDGKRLYPAMPYPSFTAINDNDIRALYVYFLKEVQPVNYKPPATKLPFPFNLRWSLIFWDAIFTRDERYQPDPERDEQWNRGAYLVQSLGHCGACHTPRGIAFQEQAYSGDSPSYLRGALIDNWFAANLTGDNASGLGRWSEAEIATFLKTGHNEKVAAFGSMIAVVENSTQYINLDDLNAIAHYLKSLPAYGEKPSYKPDRPAVAAALSALLTGETELPGAGIYNSFCMKCHRETGIGEPDKYPKLAGNSIVLSENPSSLIRLLLEGGKTAQTAAIQKSHEMPGFAKKLSDQQIAEVLSFIRHSWGNEASPVTTRQVASLRSKLKI